MSSCPRCGAVFSCGMADASVSPVSDEPCWCTKLPVLTAQNLAELQGGSVVPGCYCATCLQMALGVTSVDNAEFPP